MTGLAAPHGEDEQASSPTLTVAGALEGEAHRRFAARAGPLFRKLTGLRYDTGIHVPLGGGDPHAIGEEALVASPGVDGVLADIMRGVASLPHNQRRARSAEPVHKLAAEHRLFGQPAGACERFAGDVAQAIHDAVEARLKIIGQHRPD